MTLTPRLDVLPPAQPALWPELLAVPRRYALYGGTALALRLAHRASIDFDFFAHDPLDHRELEATLSLVKGGETVQEGPRRLKDRLVRVHRMLTPKAFVRIRRYGLLSNRVRKPLLERCREMLGADRPCCSHRPASPAPWPCAASSVSIRNPVPPANSAA